MSIQVEVAGFGICQTANPYVVMVLFVQQPNFHAWTVYRVLNHFEALSEQLQQVVPTTPPVPQIDPTNTSLQYLEQLRDALDGWIKTITTNEFIFRTQSMYFFLCAEANQPPPFLNIHWRNTGGGNGDDGSGNGGNSQGSGGGDMDMDMDDLFDGDGGGSSSSSGGGHGGGGGNSAPVDDESDSSPMSGGDYATSAGTSWGIHRASPAGAGMPGKPNPKRPSKSAAQLRAAAEASTQGISMMDEDTEDGLDIQSISLVTGAEFLYDRSQEEQDTNSGGGGGGGSSLGGGFGNGGFGISGPGNGGGVQTIPVTAPPTPPANPLQGTMGGGTSGLFQQHQQQQLPPPSQVQAPAAAPKKTISLDCFNIIKVIGKGSFGKVFLVRDKARKTLHALKVLRKDHIIKKNQVEHTKTERSVLGYVHHPFIVGLIMAFQTPDKLFFVLDYCSGGELFFHLGKAGRFSEERSMFYAGQITLALEYVHSLGIIYRDLKPENVLLDHLGNVRLTDFGLSKEGVSNASTGANSFCGTPEYIAPEVLCRQGHGKAVDWWSLGALLYEMITGLPPFYSRNRETMFEKILKAELSFPPFMSRVSRDILSRLLVRDPTQRMGSGERDAAELKEHPFFQNLDFVGLYHGRIVPPWAPTVAGSLDTSQFDAEFTSMQPTVSPAEVRGAYFGTSATDRNFEGFTYVNESAAHMMQQVLSQSHSTNNNNKGGGGGTIGGNVRPGNTNNGGWGKR